VLTTLLYGCETWTLYRRSICRLDQFHLRCLRKIAGIKWQDRVANTDVLQICGITGIEAFLLKAQLRWAGHAMRMPDDRIPKQVFCGQLAVGTRPQCGPVRRYKNSIKETMKKCEVQPSTLSIDSQDRSNWRSQCQEAVEQFEDARVVVLQQKRAVCKGEAQPTATSASGCVRAAQGSATLESGCTLANSRTDDDIDNRSVDLDGAVHTCVYVYLYVCRSVQGCSNSYTDQLWHG